MPASGVISVDEITNVRSESPSSDSLVPRRKAIKKPKVHALELPEKNQLHRDMILWFDQEMQRQASNRFQMALDEDFYDGLQWDEDDAQVLMDRGQAPVVYNEIKPTIDWMIGTERRMRIDYKVMPRRKEGADDAEAKTSLLKYLSDTNKSPYHRSRSFDDAIKSGMGVLETGLRGDPTEELLFERYQDWRSTLYDSNGVEPDMSDSRYFFRWKDLDEDIALAYFADRSDIVKASVKNEGSSEPSDWYVGQRTDPSEDWQPRTGRYQPYDGAPFTSSQRKIVRFYECWYRKPVMRKIFINGDLSGKKFDANNPDHVAAANEGYGLYDKMEMEVRVAIYTSVGIVFEGASPYRHNRFPFVVTWCYRRKRDNAPYGAIRALRDPQEGLNKRHSKAHWILSSNGVIMEKGAVDDLEETREELARPDHMIVVNAGKRFETDRDVSLADEHLQLMAQDAQYIRKIGGVNDDNLGRQTNAVSGIALQHRQDQGTIATTEPFDNHRFALQQLGEMELSMIEQFYSEAKVIRIVGGRGNAKFMELNVPGEDGRILNDMTAMQADFVMSEQDYRTTLRQAMQESLFEIVGKIAQMGGGGLQAALNMLDLVVDMDGLPNREELMSRIRKINGQRDPDAEITPEEQQAEQEAGKLDKLQKEMALERAHEELKELTAKRGSLDAKAIRERVESLYVALQAGGVVASSPWAATVADEIMRGAGFIDEQGQDPNIPRPAQTVPPVQPMQPPDMAAGARRGIETQNLNDGSRQ